MRAIYMTDKQFLFQNRFSLLVALDEEAEIVWYYIADSRIAGVHQLQNGNLFFHHVNFRSIEMDMCGNVINQFHATNRPWGPVDNSIGIEAESLHHQPHEMPDGNYLALTANAKEIENYYTSEEDPDAPRKTQKVVGDTIVEFTPKGEIVWSWNSFDYLDPMRIGYQLTDTYWHTRGFPNHLDWSHGNGVSYDLHDDSILVSLRHQDAIIKIDRKTKDIVWILGDHDGWEGELKEKLLTPTHDLRWHYHGHNPRVTGENQFVMYDNGVCRAMPFHGPSAPPHECFSRAIEYRVDPEKMEVSEVWVSSSDDSEDRVISWAMGDAHRLKTTGNMLVIDSFCTPEGPELNRLGTVTVSDLMWDSWNRAGWHPNDFATWGRIREMKRDGDQDVVFHVRVDNEHDIVGWEVFGGARVNSLYPAT
ncbi:MAG: aryl-sulfate sulfotransferase [Pseudomonadota bacterium]|nr:aryl-sulfate sulfotransferase [Pseudomonadota bacterium]